MSFTISEADVADAEIIARHVDMPAMQTGPLYRTMFPSSDITTDAQRDEVTRWYTEMLEDDFRAGWGSFLKACTSDGAVVGFCGWRVTERKGEHQQVDGTRAAASRHRKERRKMPTWVPETIDADGWFALLCALQVECDRVLKNRDNICRLGFMAVDPNHQRRGVGSMMMRRVCEEADRHGRCAYVLSPPEAVRLCTNFGFETVGLVETTYGIITSMLRQPQQA